MKKCVRCTRQTNDGHLAGKYIICDTCISKLFRVATHPDNHPVKRKCAIEGYTCYGLYTYFRVPFLWVFHKKVYVSSKGLARLLRQCKKGVS